MLFVAEQNMIKHGFKQNNINVWLFPNNADKLNVDKAFSPSDNGTEALCHV